MNTKSITNISWSTALKIMIGVVFGTLLILASQACSDATGVNYHSNCMITCADSTWSWWCEHTVMVCDSTIGENQ